MNSGDSWDVSWTVNITGGASTMYEVDTLFYSSYGSSVIANIDTADSIVLIG
ncbi:hypothetical protein [Methanococcoides sp. FTZ1]|uniref:hypothetical protein n=1 Tax=Methanococcoides sp. FTZ1 TaxID=3439061 RepID=UPI003F8758C4